MEIPGLGHVTMDADGEHQSGPTRIPVLGATVCRLVVLGYEDDEAKSDFQSAIRRFLALDASALSSSSLPIFRYYQDATAYADDDDEHVVITTPDEVWQHIRPGGEVKVQRDASGDREVYVSVECECAWEAEHGLQIVFRGGHTVTKAGPFDGHLTNVSAFGDSSLTDVVYHSIM